MLKFHFAIILLFKLVSSSGVVAQSTPELIFPENGYGEIKLNISTIPNKDKQTLDHEYLAIFVKNELEEYASNAIQGKYRVEGDYLIFKPYFPFESGMDYVLRRKNAYSDKAYSYQIFQIGKKKTLEPAKVASIFPSSHQLPENLLRIYIYFNSPMKKGQVLKHVKLIDGKGNIDNHAFMEFKQELWSEDGKRLTLLFDPGRIKRGVATNLLRGPALMQDKKYHLNISEAWQDVYGQALGVNVKKEFKVVNAYRQHIKITEWVINKPTANSHDTLSIQFDRIMDHALIQSMIQLKDTDNTLIQGYWEISAQEQLIQFIPEKKWQKGKYRITIDSRLEDVAGNNLQNLLDHLKTDIESNNQTYHYIKFEL